MASVTTRPSKVSNVLLLIALACASGWSTTRAAILEAGSRKLLQGSGPSTPFGEPAPGTFVVTWSAVPAKYSPDFSLYLQRPHPPPYQYDWFDLYQPGSGNVSLLFYPRDAYVVGAGNQKTQLPSVGACDLVTTDYPDFRSLINSCFGNFTVPANLAVSEVYFLLQAPAGLEFQVPTPLSYIQCVAPLSPSNFNQSVQGTYVNGSLGAVFDSGAVIPLIGDNLYGTAEFTTPQFTSQAFTATGTLTFQSINIRVKYDPPVQLPQGISLYTDIPYPFCYFSSKQVTVQSVPTSAPTSAPTSTPTNAPTKAPTSAPTPVPTPRTLVPPSTQCPPVNGFYTNSCFNTRGTMHVCCINPDSCGPFTADGNPTCTNGQYYVFN